MAYEMVMPYHLHMPSYFLETFTEYPFLEGKKITLYTKYKYNNKKIEAIICKTQFEDVKEALLEAKIEWLSYCNVKGIGKTCQGRI